MGRPGPWDTGRPDPWDGPAQLPAWPPTKGQTSDSLVTPPPVPHCFLLKAPGPPSLSDLAPQEQGRRAAPAAALSSHVERECRAERGGGGSLRGGGEQRRARGQHGGREARGAEAQESRSGATAQAARGGRSEPGRPGPWPTPAGPLTTRPRALSVQHDRPTYLLFRKVPPSSSSWEEGLDQH